MSRDSLRNSRYPDLFSFYCPLCSTPRRLPFKPNPQPKHYVQVALTTVMITIAAWPIFGAKGAVFFLPLWMAFEMFYRLRARARLRCDQCGFDPFLYVNDAHRAREEVQNHWRGIFAAKGKPDPYLKASAPVAPPVVAESKVASEAGAKSRGL